MKENNIIKEKSYKLPLNIPLGIPAMDILPFQGANWNNRKLAQGVVVGMEYIALSVRSKWLKTIYIPAQSNGVGYKTKTYKKRPEWAK